MKKKEVKDVLDILLDIAENHYPNYFYCDDIAYINDWYKENIGINYGLYTL